MKRVRSKTTFKATQWFKIGDHPKVFLMPATSESHSVLEGKYVIDTDGRRKHHVVQPGDWILDEEFGNYLVCPPEMFEQLFEEVK